ncbi:F0F1 ATP synthase subunit B [Myxococcota bacterium]|nr:F0F1 ATP synthase subunit B [Myxococcota bacterium]
MTVGRHRRRMAGGGTFLLLSAALAAPALAASGGGGGEGALAELAWLIFNFAVLIYVVYRFARKPISQFFSDRGAAIDADIRTASERLEEAEARHRELQSQVQGLDSELEEIRTQATRRAEAERDRILEDARLSAERIRSDASAAIAREVERAQAELRDQASELAIELAAGYLQERMDEGDRERLIEEFIERVEAGAETAEGSP